MCVPDSRKSWERDEDCPASPASAGAVLTGAASEQLHGAQAAARTGALPGSAGRSGWEQGYLEFPSPRESDQRGFGSSPGEAMVGCARSGGGLVPEPSHSVSPRVQGPCVCDGCGSCPQHGLGRVPWPLSQAAETGFLIGAAQ